MRCASLQVLIAATAIIAVAWPLHAQSTSGQDRATDADKLFHGRELSLDLFGSVSTGQDDLDDVTRQWTHKDGRWGAGLGLNYFLCRYFGVGAQAYTENTADSFVDTASGSFIVRFPFERVHLAPYALAGAGHQFDPEDRWFGQVGGGIEYRMTPHCGLFADGRYMMLDGADDVGLGRMGVRLVF